MKNNNNNNNNKKPSVAKIVANNIKYSARWKFMLISDQAKDLVKKLCGRWGLHVSFSTAGLHPGSVSREMFHVTIYVEKARVLRSNLTMFRPCYVWKYYEWFWEVL